MNRRDVNKQKSCLKKQVNAWAMYTVIALYCPDRKKKENVAINSVKTKSTKSTQFL